MPNQAARRVPALPPWGDSSRDLGGQLATQSEQPATHAAPPELNALAPLKGRRLLLTEGRSPGPRRRAGAGSLPPLEQSSRN